VRPAAREAAGEQERACTQREALLDEHDRAGQLLIA
jgi:hypothetical protein